LAAQAWPSAAPASTVGGIDVAVGGAAVAVGGGGVAVGGIGVGEGGTGVAVTAISVGGTTVGAGTQPAIEISRQQMTIQAPIACERPGCTEAFMGFSFLLEQQIGYEWVGDEEGSHSGRLYTGSVVWQSQGTMKVVRVWVGGSPI